jgi:hypothetical protein
MDALFSLANSKKFWNLLAKNCKQRTAEVDAISLAKLSAYYGERFSQDDTCSKEVTDAAASFMRAKKSEVMNLALSDEVAVCTADVDRILKRLKKGKAAGADGILAEHLIHANCPHLRLLLCDLLSHLFSDPQLLQNGSAVSDPEKAPPGPVRAKKLSPDHGLFNTLKGYGELHTRKVSKARIPRPAVWFPRRAGH